MKIQVTREKDGIHIKILGQFTFSDHAAFRELVIAHIAKTNGDGVVVDLGAMDYIDSAGLGMLLLAREMAHQNGRTITLAGARDQVARMLTVSKFDTLFVLGQ